MTDYRSVIAHSLAKRPFDEESVHDCVCTYVRAERDNGRSASDVIVALSELVERPGGASTAVRHTLTRRVIPWCVEAYFGTPKARAGARERHHGWKGAVAIVAEPPELLLIVTEMGSVSTTKTLPPY
jgi:hypothetical protein